MFNVSVKWDFDERRFTDEVTKAAFKNTVEQWRQKLSMVRCPTHDQHPTLRVTGQSQAKLNLEIEGCCQELLDAANARLGIRR